MNLMSTRRDGNLFRAVLCMVLILSSGLTGKSQTPIKSRPLPIGTLVDVGGYRVHLYCLGQGSPTVMIVGALFLSTGRWFNRRWRNSPGFAPSIHLEPRGAIPSRRRQHPLAINESMRSIN